jgi:hypothetical protein
MFEGIQIERFWEDDFVGTECSFGIPNFPWIQKNFIQCGNFNWNKIRNLDMGNFLKKSRNKSIIVFPCPHFGVYGFCLSASGSAQPPLTFFFSNIRVCQVLSHLKGHILKNTTLYLFPEFKACVPKKKLISDILIRVNTYHTLWTSFLFVFSKLNSVLLFNYIYVYTGWSRYNPSEKFWVIGRI